MRLETKKKKLKSPWYQAYGLKIERNRNVLLPSNGKNLLKTRMRKEHYCWRAFYPAIKF